MSKLYSVIQPERRAIDAIDGAIALEFGTDWCGYCRSAAPIIDEALREFPNLQHMKVEDGQGRALGRSFRVKLWPTVVVLRSGQELARVVRPADVEEVRRALAASNDG